jgi:hypothetical protein
MPERWMKSASLRVLDTLRGNAQNGIDNTVDAGRFRSDHSAETRRKQPPPPSG